MIKKPTRPLTEEESILIAKVRDEAINWERQEVYGQKLKEGLEAVLGPCDYVGLMTLVQVTAQNPDERGRHVQFMMRF